MVNLASPLHQARSCPPKGRRKYRRPEFIFSPLSAITFPLVSYFTDSSNTKRPLCSQDPYMQFKTSMYIVGDSSRETLRNKKKSSSTISKIWLILLPVLGLAMACGVLVGLSRQVIHSALGIILH